MTAGERKRGAKENYLAYCLKHEFTSQADLIEFIVYNLSDEELDKLVQRFNSGNSTLPPIIPGSKEDQTPGTPSRCIDVTYVYTTK